MKRFFSLLALLVATVTMGGYVHADEVMLGRSVPYSADAKEYTLYSNNNAIVTIADGDISKGSGSAKPVFYKSGTSVNMAVDVVYRNVTASTSTNYNSINTDSYVGFCIEIKEGFKLSINKLETSIAVGADKFNYKLELTDGTNVIYSSNNYTLGNYKSADATNADVSIKLTPNKELLKGKYYVKLYGWFTKGTSKYFVPLKLTVTGDLTQLNTNQLAAPSIEYTEDGLVTITNNDSRTSKIYYTTDGTEPSATNGTEYTKPFSAPGKTVKAITIGDGYDASTVAEKAVPKKATGTVIYVSKVTVAGTAISDANLKALVENKTLTLTEKYSVAPAVVFTKTTTTNYNDGSKDSNDENVDATVIEEADNFVATATIGDNTYTINLPIDKAPVINADVTSFDLSAKRANIATQPIKFSAVNTSGVLTVSVPQIDGLSVKMTHVVTDANNKQKDEELKSGAEVKEDEVITMTVSYQSDVVVEKAFNKITIAVGETTLDIPFTYEDTEDMIKTIDDVTGDMSWDFANASADANKTINSPRPLEVVPYTNAEGLSDNFGYKYLKAKAQNFYRADNYNCYQGTEIIFHTTKSGHVKVLFANPNSKSTRTAKINGIICNDNGIKGGKRETAIIAEADVPAGDVSILGWLLSDDNDENNKDVDSQLRIYTIEFTADETTDVAIGTVKMATYCNASAWTVPSDLEVYTAKYADSKVKLTQVEAGKVIKAGEGVVLFGEPKTYKVAYSAEAGEELDNSLVGVTEDTQMNNETTYVLVKGADGKVCFGKLKSGETVKAGKAYLTIDDLSAAKQISLDFGSTTGINAVESAEEAQNGAYYTLSGQRTMKPTKGVYIHNGKKFMK